ncbi:unnamed protein product [Owenia fusiformis]|uniref:Uncharacterized protein n=1 Tax=Owenia fusiformis TaxID=6347 RepID=A0A8J1Y0P6_OWEFU|nr:unnamed protein product [Owenia fusiformis]
MIEMTKNKFFVYITLTFVGVLIGFLFGGINIISSTYSKPFGNPGDPVPLRKVSVPRYGSKIGNSKIIIPASKDNSSKRTIPTTKGEFQSAGTMTAQNITKIIILTYRRSGSSFFAELFKQNPNIFYMFEPLKAVVERYDIDTPVAGPAFLKEIMNCRFSGNSYLSQVTSMHGWRWQAIFRNVKILNDVPKVCVDSDIVASKIIRLANIGQIAPYFGKDTAILFLARDPRGILNSRNHETRSYKNLALELKKKDMESLCYNSLTNINFIKDLKAKRKELDLKPLIKQVIYEDFAYDTLTNAQKLYKALDIPFHQSVRYWIGKNTSTFSGGTYGTSRNSTSIPTKWMVQLSPVELNMIQNITDCREVIQSLGFKIQ